MLRNAESSAPLVCVLSVSLCTSAKASKLKTLLSVKADYLSQHTSAYLCIPLHTSAYFSIPQNTSPFLSMRQLSVKADYLSQYTSAYLWIPLQISAYVSIPQHSSAYISLSIKAGYTSESGSSALCASVWQCVVTLGITNIDFCACLSNTLTA